MFNLISQNNNKNIEKRRKLRNEKLEFTLESGEGLLEDFVELEAKFVGNVQQISLFYDIKIKKNLFKLIEDEQNKLKLATDLDSSNDAIVRVNAYIVELLWRDSEEMIAAFPLHNIANVCYAQKTKNSNVIAIQYCNAFESNEYYNVYLLHLNSRSEAESMCSLFKQCFRLLHVERTMSLLDQVLREETISNYSSSNHVYEPNEYSSNFEMTPNFQRKQIAGNNTDDDTKSLGCSTIHDQIQQPEVIKPTVKVKMDAHQTIASFINKLQKELNKIEFENFAKALTDWQKGEPFEKFCQEALKICGSERKYLIKDMRPFVPNKNLEWYENFVEESINEVDNLKRPDSVSSNESSSSLVGDNARSLNRSTRTLQNSDQSLN